MVVSICKTSSVPSLGDPDSGPPRVSRRLAAGARPIEPDRCGRRRRRRRGQPAAPGGLRSSVRSSNTLADPTPAPLSLAGPGAAKGPPRAPRRPLRASGCATDRQAHRLAAAGPAAGAMAPYLAAVLTQVERPGSRPPGGCTGREASARRPRHRRSRCSRCQPMRCRLTEARAKTRRTLAGWQQFTGDGIRGERAGEAGGHCRPAAEPASWHLERDRQPVGCAGLGGRAADAGLSAASVDQSRHRQLSSASRAPTTGRPAALAANPKAGAGRWPRTSRCRGGRLDVTDAAAHARPASNRRAWPSARCAMRLGSEARQRRPHARPTSLGARSAYRRPGQQARRANRTPAAGVDRTPGPQPLPRCRAQPRLDRLPLHVAEPWARRCCRCKCSTPRLERQGRSRPGRGAGGWEVRIKCRCVACRPGGSPRRPAAIPTLEVTRLLSWQNLAWTAWRSGQASPARPDARRHAAGLLLAPGRSPRQGRFQPAGGRRGGGGFIGCARRAPSAPPDQLHRPHPGPVASAAASQGTSAGASGSTSPAAGRAHPLGACGLRHCRIPSAATRHRPDPAGQWPHRLQRPLPCAPTTALA